MKPTNRHGRARIFAVPRLEGIDLEVCSAIEGLRQRLRNAVASTPVRWTGLLRRTTFARALQGSNSIEGFHATLAEAVEIVDDARPTTLAEETYQALVGYRQAMTYVMRLATDPHLNISPELIAGLHFMVQHYDMTKMPGQWRTGPIYVVRDPENETVYEGPEADQVPLLIESLVEQIAEPQTDTTVAAAMAHLNLAMIHPFKDGNGRMARALQTLVLARGGIVNPEFASIEEWLGRNTQPYYNILSQTGEGKWSPSNSALPWVRFCLRAHYQQAFTIQKRHAVVGRLFQEMEILADQCSLPSRTHDALVSAALGLRLDNPRYRDMAAVTDATATRDLRSMTEWGLLEAVGEKRGRTYIAGAKIRAIGAKVRDRRSAPDPYALLTEQAAAQQIPLEF